MNLENISMREIFVLLFQMIPALAGMYFLFSKNFYRISVGIFLQTLSIAGLVLFLGYKVLALILFFWAFLGTVLFISFSSSIVGNLKVTSESNEGGAKALLLRIAGIVVGVFLGGAFLYGLGVLDGPIAGTAGAQELSVESLGQQLLGDQLLAFYLMGFSVLVVILGAAALKRRIS